jgi:prophage tail gpP-like protein
LSTSYRVAAGDTFVKIARKKYGIEDNASLIVRANPGVLEPLTAGTLIIIPDAPAAPANRLQDTLSNSASEVAVIIDGERFRFWDSVTINRSMDSIDSIEIRAPFEPDNAAFRETFRPLSYKSLNVTVGGSPLFIGTMLTPRPETTEKSRTVVATGYSLPGVLNDCTAPISALPLEFNNQGLQEIADTLAGLFGLSIDFNVDQGATFERVALDPDKDIYSFLSDLARQRNLVIGTTNTGKLLFQRSISTGAPVARLSEGAAPLLLVAPEFKDQEYYSHVTGLQGSKVGRKGSQYTVVNPRVEGVLRPITFKVDDTQDADVKAAVEAKAGRMFANAVGYSVNVATWRDTAGTLWTPNTTIKLQAPGAMIYNEYEFLIRSVRLSREADNEQATLSLVLPGSFEGVVPGAMPWD